MIRYIHYSARETNLLSSPLQRMIVPVSLDGVIPEADPRNGSRCIARQFADQWPGWVPVWQQYCREGKIKPGMLYFPLKDTGARHLIVFPVQHVHDGPADLELIKAGLRKLASLVGPRQIASIATTKLGCGRGQLSWDTVGPVMAEAFTAMGIRTDIYIGAAHRDKEYYPEPVERPELEGDGEPAYYSRAEEQADIANGAYYDTVAQQDAERPDVVVEEPEPAEPQWLVEVKALLLAEKLTEEHQLECNAAALKILAEHRTEAQAMGLHV